MRKDFFDSHEELCDYMIDKAQDGFYTVAVLFYEDAIKLIRELMMYSDINVEALEIAPSEYGGYEKEYYVSLTDDMFASVEPAYIADRYLDAEADLTLIDGNASSAILKHIQENKCHEIYIGEYEDDIYDFDEDYEEYDSLEDDEALNDIFEKAKLIKDDNGNTIGIKVDAQSIFNYLFG